MAVSRLLSLFTAGVLYCAPVFAVPHQDRRSSLNYGYSTDDGQGQCESARYQAQPRVFVLTDMSNEPDDQMSLVRFLTYANELDIQGIGGITSQWKNDSIDLDTIHTVISAYGNATANLNANVPSYAAYPSAESLIAKVHSGHPVYGLASLELEPSGAAVALVSAIDSASAEKPQWVLCWGGAAVLAEALNHVSKTRNESAVASFVEKIRVYSISDQDDAGSWIRDTYPSIFFVVTLHSFNEYTSASWNGISGENLRYFDQGGPDSSIVTNEWLQEHIREVGPLGQHYPEYEFIMEGDTPSFFPLIQNGLGDPEHPEWGSWGGRFKPLDQSRRSGTFTDAADWVQGLNGQFFMTIFGTIWRWRRDYQYDFANRMQWSASSDYASLNHAPVVVVNGTCGPAPLKIPNPVNSSVVLDASATWDPENDQLTFEWLYYKDVTYRLEGNLTKYDEYLKIDRLNDAGTMVRISTFDDEDLHVVLSVTDPHNMTTYRRIILESLD